MEEIRTSQVSSPLDGPSIHFLPVGYFRSDQKHSYEAGRQPDERHSPGTIALLSGKNFEQALVGLEGFSHLWIVFQFHLNLNWKPMVSPPRGSAGKVGVFASRSPYRPNNIGMSVVRLEKIDGLKLVVTEADLLDGSPILDIKPYLAYVDSKPEATMGWIANEEKYTLSWSLRAQEQLTWLKTQGLSQIEGFIFHQLEYEPINEKKKRVKPAKSPSEGDFVLSYRTWRVTFSLNSLDQEKTKREIKILNISSGYSANELNPLAENYSDPYADKDLHRRFER